MVLGKGVLWADESSLRGCELIRGMACKSFKCLLQAVLSKLQNGNNEFTYKVFKGTTVPFIHKLSDNSR